MCTYSKSFLSVDLVPPRLAELTISSHELVLEINYLLKVDLSDLVFLFGLLRVAFPALPALRLQLRSVYSLFFQLKKAQRGNHDCLN